MMATEKPSHCLHCRSKLGYFTMTLARAVAGDLVFCSYRCLTAWENQTESTMAGLSNS